MIRCFVLQNNIRIDDVRTDLQGRVARLRIVKRKD